MVGLFDFDLHNDKTSDKELISKTKVSKNSTISVKGTKNLAQKIAAMKDNVERYLGDKREDFICIINETDLINYISACIINGIVAIDTETTGLNPLTCEIVGM